LSLRSRGGYDGRGRQPLVDRAGGSRLTRAAQRVASSLWLSSSHVIGWGHAYGAGKIVSTAATATAQRTVGRLFLPEFRWVDDVAPKARIAAYLPFIVSKDLPPRFYGLCGRHFQHRVFALPSRTQAATMSWLDAHDIDYVYVSRASPQDGWLRSASRFRVLWASAGAAAYARKGLAGWTTTPR
jgi:hypothetical protein